MWINDTVIYTPRIVEMRQGKAENAVIKSVGADGNTLLLSLSDGTEKRVDAAHCKPATA